MALLVPDDTLSGGLSGGEPALEGDLHLLRVEIVGEMLLFYLFFEFFAEN